jgi:hypothetical protein
VKKAIAMAASANSMKSVWDMKKQELIEELEYHGVKVNHKITVPELREMLKETRGPTGKDPMCKYNQMKVAELRHETRLLLGYLPDQQTQGALLRAIRRHITAEPGGTNTIMAFGEHSDKTFGWVQALKPQYCHWAMNEARDNSECSDYLKRFAAFLETTTTPKTEVKQEAKTEKPKPAEKWQVKKEQSSSSNPKPWPQNDKMAAAVPAGTEEDSEELIRDQKEGPPQWDGEDSSLAEYIMRTKAYKQMEKIRETASMKSSQAGHSWTAVNRMEDTTSKRKP